MLSRSALSNFGCLQTRMPLNVLSRKFVTENLGDLSMPATRSPFTMTKLVCTIGPVSEDAETLQKCVTEGMRIMRINFSHATFEEADMRMTNLAAARGSHTVGEYTNTNGDNKPVLNVRASLLDTRGPEIRMGKFDASFPKKVEFVKGNSVTVTTNPDYRDTMSDKVLYVDYPALVKTMNLGDTILFDDGLVGMKVTGINSMEDSVECEVANSGSLGSRKGVNLPGKIVDLPPLTEKDLIDLKYGVENDMDFVAVSFVRKARDVAVIREHLQRMKSELTGPAKEKAGPIPMIISKIENGEALHNFAEILKESDGIMVARGDLGVEIPFEKVTRAQKMMVDECRKVGKPVIVATQMLESMQQNPRPTRAEVSDVTNAVLDGADAVMLSGESANGKYPIESIAAMTTIIKEADNYQRSHACSPVDYNNENVTTREHTARVAVDMANSVNAAMVIVLADTGRTARLVSKYRPRVPIMAFCSHPKVARQVNIMHGVYPLVMPATDATPRERIKHALKTARDIKWVKKGDTVVFVNAEKSDIDSEEVDPVLGTTAGVFTTTVL